MEQAHPLARILELIVFLPDGSAETFTEHEILLAGLQGTTSVARIRTDAGQEIDFVGLPLKITKGPPSGLVAPSGRGVIPPT